MVLFGAPKYRFEEWFGAPKLKSFRIFGAPKFSVKTFNVKVSKGYTRKHFRCSEKVCFMLASVHLERL